MNGASRRADPQRDLPNACDQCLRRMRLVGLLAPFIERVATGERGGRSPELLALPDEKLARAVAGRKARRLLDEAEGGCGALRAELGEAGCWSVCHHDRAYPAALRDPRDAPPALAGRGDPAGLGRLRPEATVTVVGARRATSYGREIARSLAGELARTGFAVVSGLAWGIDGCAHEGALAAPGFTAAVLGCGADVAYPRNHSGLYDRILERGLILSELPPGTGAFRWAFPARNRIMAGLGAMTVVVEAAGRSGSLITAELASELGREVGAVPGPVGTRMSAGTNGLIADGARLVRGAQDVLDALIGPGSVRPTPCGPALDADLAAVLDRVEAGDADSDAIAVVLGCGGGEATARLARLELMGYARRSFAGAYSRTALPRPDQDPDADVPAQPADIDITDQLASRP